MTNEQYIWKYLKQHSGWTDEGIAGVIGNLQAESALIPNNVQNSYEGKVGTDKEYTEKVDSGSYSRDNFRTDAAGYGLAQWTYHSRKANLYDFAQKMGRSIGDMEMQCAFLVAEMRGYYSGLNVFLQKTASVRDAACNVLFQYEQPANQGKAVQDTRTVYSENIYKRNHTDAQPVQAGVKEQLEDIMKRLQDIIKEMEEE